jgi:hypothetical protein
MPSPNKSIAASVAKQSDFSYVLNPLFFRLTTHRISQQKAQNRNDLFLIHHRPDQLPFIALPQ